MTAYYLDHTDLLESPDEKHTTPCTDRLTKRYIRAVLQDLHDMSHHIYILLENLPEYRFAIVRNYDHVRRIVRPDARFEIDNFTLHQFLTHFDLLHESDGFYVRFYTEMFCYEHGFTPQILEIVYRHYLKYLCKCDLRENTRVYLTEESAREYGLTDSDVKILLPQIHPHNASIVADLQPECSFLSIPDCLENEGREETDLCEPSAEGDRND